MWGFWRSEQHPNGTQDMLSPGSERQLVTEMEDDEDEFVTVTTTDEDKERLRQVQGELAQERERTAKLAADLRGIRQQLDNAEKIHSRNLEVKDRMVAQKEAKIVELDKRLRGVERSLNAKTAELAAQQQNLNQQAGQYESELAELRRECGRTRQLHEELRAELQECHAQAGQLRAQLRDAEAKAARVPGLQAEVAQLHEKVQSEAKERKAKEALAEALNLQLAEIRRQRDREVVQLRETQHQMQQSATGESRALQDELRSTREQLARSQEQLRRAELHQQDLEVRLSVASKELVENKAEFATLRGSLHSLQSQHASEMERSSRALRDAEARARAQEAEKVRLEQANRDLEQQLKQEKATELARKAGALREVSQKERALETELERLRRDAEAKEAELATARFTLETLQHEFDDYKAATSAELRDLVSQTEHQKQDLARANEAVDEITRQASTRQQQTTPRHQPKPSGLQRMLEENPTKVPIRCERADDGTSYALLTKAKFAVHQDLSLEQFGGVVRNKLGLGPSDPLYLKLATPCPLPATSNVGVLYERCKNADGFLVLKYSSNP